MKRRDAPAPWFLASVLAAAFGGLVLLMAGVAGNRAGMELLPARGTTLDVLPDAAKRLTFADVQALPETAWRRWTSDYYIQAFDGGAVWVRVTLTNPSARPWRGVLADDELIADHLDCWTRDASVPGGWLQQSAGEWVAGADKPIWGRGAAFYVTVPAGGEAVAYLRAQDHFGVWLRAAWWPEARAFLAAQLRDTLAEAIYFGVLAALLIYNGVLWSRLRHRDLGRYLGYLGAWAVFMALGRAQPQVVGLPLGTPLLEPLAMAALAGSSFCFVQFAREFLGLRTVAPRFDRFARWLGWLNLAFLVGSVSLLWSRTSFWMHVVIPGATATYGVLLIAGVIAWRAGVWHARYFLLSFGLLLSGAIPFVVNWLFAIPLGNTALALMIGSAMEMLLLSLALADRFARLEAERQRAQLSEEKAQLEMLRYQLNPHFLFNALNSIYGFVLPHSRPAAELVRQLAEFCRHTLTRRHGEWHPLGEELAMLRTYLDIEQLRWGERLAVEFTAADDVAEDLLPPFLLLPLVENAIKHGGATSPGRLDVRLDARHEAPGVLRLTITNSGHWQAAGEPRTVSSTGIGLENLRARLARSFPGTHALDTRVEGGFVTITLRLPVTTVAPR